MALMWDTVRTFIWPSYDKREKVHKKERVASESGNTIFVVYSASQHHLVSSQVVPKLRNYKTVLVHRDCPVGHNVYTFIDNHIRNRKVPVIVILTTDFSKCELCTYIQKNIPPFTSQDGKIIPILVDKHSLPFCLKTTATVALNENGIKKLKETLDFFFGLTTKGYHNELNENVTPTNNNFYLIPKEVPDKKLKACMYLRDFRGDKHSERWDHKIVLQLLTEDKAGLPSRTNIQYKVVGLFTESNGSFKQENEKSIEKYVKILPIPETAGLMDCLSRECTRDFSFWVRFYHPDGVESLETKLRFTVYTCESKDGHLSIPAITKELTFATKQVIKKKKEVRQRNRLDNDADWEKSETETDQRLVKGMNRFSKNASKKSTNQTQRQDSSAGADQETTENVSKYRGSDKTEKVLISHLVVERIYSTGFLRRTEVRCMLRKIEYLADNEEQDMFNEVTRSYLQQYSDQRRWDEYILVVIKKIALAHYKNDLKDCKENVKLVDKHLAKCRFPEVLKARLLYYKSAIYREEKLFPKAEDAIQKCLQILERVECGEDTAKGYYNLGKLYMTMVESQVGGGSSYKVMAIEAFQRAMEHFLEDNIVDAKQIRRCLLNISRVAVDCPMKKLKSGQLCWLKIKSGHLITNVTVKDITTAKKALKDLRRYYPKQTSRGDSITLRNLIQILYSESEILFTEAILNYKDSGRKQSLMFECYSKLREVRTLTDHSKFKETESIKTFVDVVESLCGKSLFKSVSEQELNQNFDVYLGDQVSSADMSPVDTTGIEELSDRGHKSEYDSDRL